MEQRESDLSLEGKVLVTGRPAEGARKRREDTGGSYELVLNPFLPAEINYSPYYEYLTMSKEKSGYEQKPSEERPPIFRTWNQMYAFVLILHAVIITLFYVFTRAYS